MFFVLELCHNNINQVPGEQYPTTPEDLQGFWDMVMLQVNHIDSLFEMIETIKASNWKVRSYLMSFSNIKQCFYSDSEWCKNRL